MEQNDYGQLRRIYFIRDEIAKNSRTLDSIVSPDEDYLQKSA
jgi:hypothetical protein